MNYLSICQELEEVKASIKNYEWELERKQTRAKELEEYKKSIEEGIKPVYVEAKELQETLLSNYKSLLKDPITFIQGSWGTFDFKVNAVSWGRRLGESKVIFHKDLTDDYYSELLLELNKLKDFKIETEKEELTQRENNQFTDETHIGDFNYGTLKGITKFKVAKFEKVLQLLNFPKVINVVGRVQYILNEDTKEYELKFER